MHYLLAAQHLVLEDLAEVLFDGHQFIFVDAVDGIRLRDVRLEQLVFLVLTGGCEDTGIGLSGLLPIIKIKISTIIGRHYVFSFKNKKE